MAAMDENPYKAPAEDARASSRKTIGVGRHFILIVAFSCALVSALSLFAFGLTVGEIATAQGIAASQMYAVWAGVFLMNAATWAATAWALWSKRSRIAIAAVLADVLALAFGYLGGVP